MRGAPRNFSACRLTAAGTSALLLQLLGAAARAQVAQPQPVPDLIGPSARQEEAGVGMRLGSFLFLPSLQLGEEFENNVFSTHSDVHSDFITIARPAFDLISDWNVNAFALHAEGDLAQYSKFTSENSGDILVNAEGRLDISYGQYLDVDAGFQSLHEERSSPDQLQSVLLAGGTAAKEPTQFIVETGDLRYVYSPGLIKLELDGGIVAYEFTNTPTTNGGLAINSDRNRTEYTVTPRIGYEFLDGYQAYFQISGDRHQYQATFDASPERLRRDSSGYAASVGIDVKVSALITGTFYAGYEGQYYDDPRLSTVEGAYFGGSLRWDPTESTELKLTLSRQISDTIVVGSSGFWDTQVSLNVDQKLIEDVHLNGTVTYINSDYQGSNLDDSQYDLKAGAVWTLNRYVDVNLSAEWLHQTSNQPINGFDQEIVQLGLKLRL